MEIYLVGGAVRDQLLGLPVTERDWVVVGATAEQMIAQGFKPVGKEFPVFLHPETHEEYALARTERKVSKGYKGFRFYASPEVTLEEDLLRRDLTINAIAQSSSGHIIDPYGGQSDLKLRVFRHVSAAFSEDPVRILRVARFASRFPDFSIHPETLDLMRAMVAAGEVEALVAERVWQEFSRALEHTRIDRFFRCLEACHALDFLFPMFDSRCIPPIPSHFQLASRFAILVHTFSLQDLHELTIRYPIPAALQELARLVIEHGPTLRALGWDDPEDILSLLLKTDALRRSSRFEAFLHCVVWCDPDIQTHALGRLLHCLESIKKVDTTPLQQQHIKGEKFAEALYKLRIAVLFDMLNTWKAAQ